MENQEWTFTKGGECKECHRTELTELDKSDICKDCFAKAFLDMSKMSELRALSQYSLVHPLTDDQYNRLMELKKEVFGT